MSVKLLTEHHLEFLSLTGGCTGSSESTFVKMPYCWKSHVTAQMLRVKSHVDLLLVKENHTIWRCLHGRRRSPLRPLSLIIAFYVHSLGSSV